MPYPSLPDIAQFIAGVGLPGVIALGMMFLLYQGLGILRGISSTLERMDVTLKTTVCPFTTNPTLIKEISNGKPVEPRPQVPAPVAV